MGWICNHCGNKEQFIEQNKVETKVVQNKDSSSIIKTVHTLVEEPPTEVSCSICQSRNIKWEEMDQDDSHLFAQEGFLSQKHAISTLVFELTTKNDIEDIYEKREEKEINFEVVKKILRENKELNYQIPHVELGWDKSNPLLYPRISEVLDSIDENGWNVNIITNGKNFIEHCGKIRLTKSQSFTFFLDFPSEEENDKQMGGSVFSGTMKALDFLHQHKIPTDVYMRVGNNNYDQIEKMNDLCKKHNVRNFIPIEIYPFDTKIDFTMTDKLKRNVIASIEKLNLNKSIHFYEGILGNDCTYQRRQRLHFDVDGTVSFCHFLRTLPGTQIEKDKSLSLLEYIQRNNKARVGFLRNKEKLFGSWQKERETASPCSYCLHAFKLQKKW